MFFHFPFSSNTHPSLFETILSFFEVYAERDEERKDSVRETIKRSKCSEDSINEILKVTFARQIGNSPN